MALFIVNGKIVLENGILAGHGLVVWDGRIQEILMEEELKTRNLKGHQVIDAKGGYISPGWIDIHCHGAVGFDVMDCNPEGLIEIARFKASQGVTGFVPTAITSPLSEIEKAVEAVKIAEKNILGGARILGIHLEGPFINPEKKGAHRAEMIIPHDAQWTRKIRTEFPGILIVTIAPEMNGALQYIKQMKEEGVLIAIGHSNGKYTDIKAAYEAGASHGVHTFNGMRELNHREPGVVGAILDLPLLAEIIVDGIHVHPVIVRLLSRLKLPNQIILVTDAMRAAGLEDGEYILGGLKVYKRGKEARLTDGTLAGSTLTMQEAVQNAINLAGLSITDVMRMASTTPARLLGVFENKGSIALGKDADLTILSPKLQVMATVIKGDLVFPNNL